MEHTRMAKAKYKRGTGVLFCIVLIFGCLVTADAATTVRFGDNTGDDFPGTVEDAMIWEKTVEQLNNYGAKPNINVGERASVGKDRRSLIRFKDIFERIGPGRVITSATMHLYCDCEETTTDYSISVYRVLLNWVEGNESGGAQTGACCWNFVRNENDGDWNTAGCDAADDVTGEDSTADRKATPEDSTTITSTGERFSWDLTAAVQNWYSGGWREYGVILICDSEDPNTKKCFASSENEADGQRPYLEVTYEADPNYHVTHNSHITHFRINKGPGLSMDESGCTTCHAAGSLQCDPGGPLFNNVANPDGPALSLDDTDVCDPCHSPGGVFPGANGLDDPDIGAKANWEGGVYDGDNLMSGKEKWCATCHDDQPANSAVDGTGISAPKVMGDNAIYGYYVSGHGRSGINEECAGCHDLTLAHIDGEPRTFEIDEAADPDVVVNGYQDSYRLKYHMDVPRYQPNPGWNKYSLCFHCHDYRHVFNETLQSRSNFRDDGGYKHHDYHLLGPADTITPCWDSDVDGTPDSQVSCPACHNVHGSPMEVAETLYANPVMIRHGELVGHVPAFDFVWYDAYYWDLNKQPTPNLADSLSGRMLVGSDLWTNNVCGTVCHNGAAGYSRWPILTGGGTIILIDDFQEYTDDTTLRANWKRGQDSKKPFFESSGGPDGSKCMRVKLLWDKDPNTYGSVHRVYDPYIDLTGTDSFNFFVKIQDIAKIQSILVRLRKYPENTFCVASISGNLQSNVWKLISVPRASFDVTNWGLVNKIQFRMFEINGSASDKTNVYFDNVYCGKP